MKNSAEQCFYTVLIIILLLVAILVPIIVTRVTKEPQRILLNRANQTTSEELEQEGTTNFNNPEELSKQLDDFVDKHNLMFVKNELGRTSGKNPVEQIILKRKTREKIVIVASGLQANDWASTVTTIRIMHRFFSDMPETSPLLKIMEIHFLPLLNPDGYQYSKSLPIRSNWVNNNKGLGVLNGFENDVEEVKIFQDYVNKYKNNILAAFFLFTPQPVNYTRGIFTIQSKESGENNSTLLQVAQTINEERHLYFKYSQNETAPRGRIDQWMAQEVPSSLVVDFMANFKPGAPEYVQKTTRPSTLNKPWILSRLDEETQVSIPGEVAKFLKNYHVMAIEFLYHNYRRGIKGAILNLEPEMNYPLQLSTFFRALVGGPALILVICSRLNGCLWHYHLTKCAKFDVIPVTTKNSTDSYKGNTKKLALLVYSDCLKLCEELVDHDFFSVVIEDLDQIAVKRVIKRLSGSYNVGLTYRSFYTDPDQKLQWNMLNWANPGCVGKLNEFYEEDNRNFDNFNDNYRHWWLRLNWQFCESFERPTEEELEAYNQEVKEWASENSLTFTKQAEKKSRKRKNPEKFKPTISEDTVISDSYSSDSTIINEVPSDKYVKLPSMDESPIVTSIIENFKTSPEPILNHTYTHSLPYTQTQPTCSTYSDENSVIVSFLKDDDKPSTSRSESEDFILNLI